jgi:hypothetical protein
VTEGLEGILHNSGQVFDLSVWNMKIGLWVPELL